MKTLVITDNFDKANNTLIGTLHQPVRPYSGNKAYLAIKDATIPYVSSVASFIFRAYRFEMVEFDGVDFGEEKGALLGQIQVRINNCACGSDFTAPNILQNEEAASD